MTIDRNTMLNSNVAISTQVTFLSLIHPFEKEIQSINPKSA